MKTEDNRLLKAKSLLKGGKYKVIDIDSIEVNGYRVTINSCTCMDFKTRKVTCKHQFLFQLIQQDKLQSINYMRLEDAICFEKKYGIATLAYLKGIGEVFEDRNKLIWF